MAFPASLTLVTVNVRADLLPSGGSTGWVRLYYGGLPLTGPTADSIVAYIDETRTFDAAGTCSMQVPATNATGWTPQNFTYNVTVRSGTRIRRGTVQLDRNTTTVNLADVIQWEGAAEPGVTYATLAQLDAVIALLATYATDAEVAAALAAYLTAAAATATYLPKVAGEVVDSTLVVRKGDDSSGIRMRATGGAVDYDKMNGDIVVSSFAGPGFTGTQTGLQRWRATGSTFAGLTEFGDTIYGGQQSIDAAAGVALLGAKNSLANLRLCGRKLTGGAPTTGTWTAGDLIIDSAGVWHLCTTGGSPGTWT